MRAFGGEVERELDTVKPLHFCVCELLNARTVRRNTGFDTLGCQVFQNPPILGVKAIFSHPKVHGLHWNTLADQSDIVQLQTVKPHIRAITMRTAQVTFVRETDANRKRHDANPSMRNAVSSGVDDSLPR